MEETSSSNHHSLPVLQKQAHEISRSNGFWDVFAANRDNLDVLLRDISTRLFLIADEAHEALGEIRGHSFDTETANGVSLVRQIPESFGEELADIIIRTLDVAEGLGIDLEGHVVRKIEKNRGRPRRHGKNF